jgi:uncharacterized protein YbjT (DUF2867 family)
MEPGIIVLAGATGDLGGRIAAALRRRGAGVRALVRHGSSPDRVEALRQQGMEIAKVDFGSSPDLARACAGGSCVVSALAGLRDVIVRTQALLLDAAIAAGVPRFIPSDFSIDFTKLRPGTNRNLDLRREFHQKLAEAPIAATSILNGMFAELLAGQAPYILFKLKRVVYWGDPDQKMDFTTKDDTAAFTAAAALDAASPRFLRIAGDQRSARELADVASEVTGERFRLLRAGNLGALQALIRITRSLLPRPDDLYPPWQGMQYMANMFGGRAKLDPLDNARYPGMHWTPVRDVLAARRSR